jgi:hypothetical protein
MKSKTINAIYWVLTILFSLAMLGDAYGGLTMQKEGVDVLNHLGYPLYTMPLFAVAKILGVIAILQPRYKTIKEWAYAGYTFNFICAFASRAIVGDPIGQLMPPVVLLITLLVAYYFWKKKTEISVA